MKLRLKSRGGILFISICSIWLVVASCSQSGVTDVNTSNSAPIIQLTDMNGQAIDSSTVSKPMFVSFWASWCSYCKQEMPIIEAMYHEYKDSVEFVSINMTHQDAESSARVYVKLKDYQMPVYLDHKGNVSDSFDIISLPTAVFIDRNGNIVRRIVGSSGENAEETFKKQLDDLL
jgi:thiol-disulfide isomerase/thioredoxin